jgi:hypothetical protein
MFEAHRATVREAYALSLDHMLDRVIGEFLLPDHQQVAVLDAVQFTVFVAATKVAQILGHKINDRKELMQVFRKLNMAIEKDVPTMLMQFVDAANRGEA